MLAEVQLLLLLLLLLLPATPPIVLLLLLSSWCALSAACRGCVLQALCAISWAQDGSGCTWACLEPNPITSSGRSLPHLDPKENQNRCQKDCLECQNIFQIQCQKECQNKCQIECQNRCCQTECQKRCQIECQNGCQKNTGIDARRYVRRYGRKNFKVYARNMPDRMSNTVSCHSRWEKTF